MYAIKWESEDRLFIERSSTIKRMKPHEVMIYLGIKEKFHLGENVVSQRFSYLGLEQSKYSSSQPRESAVNSPFKESDHQHTQANLKEQDLSHYDSHRSDLIALNGVLSSAHHHNNDHQSVFNNSSTSSSLGLGPLTKSTTDALPYSEAIKSLEKIQ